ncbi:MAG TPA: TIGR00366 family protein, partial [Xanthomonadales bacterium]|nr:TIGR00366 family protein [Xanthomonadales bacterium]
MIQRLTRFCVRGVERWLPDPFVLVLLLTLVVFVAGIGIERQRPLAMLEHWGNGFWQLLGFSMQMVLILVTGWVLATTVFVRRILEAAARLARTPGQAIVAVTLVSLVAAWVNWGFGLVIGAMFARELARGVQGVDYRLLIAGAYSGFVVWHGGLSGSVPLTIATDGHFMAAQMGVIGTGATIFSGYNLAILATLFVLLPLVNRLMMPRPDEAVAIDPALLARAPEDEPIVAPTPAQRLERSVSLSLAVGVMGLAFVAYHFAVKRGGINLDIVNFAFLMLGIVLHGRPSRFLAAVNDAARGAAGIIVQFPFYAGIMGMMLGSGLAASLSAWFVSISDARTLPLFTFL